MTVRLTHGTTRVKFSQLGCRRWSSMMFHARTRPSTVPTTIDVSARNEDSSRRRSHYSAPEADRAHDADPLAALQTERALMTPSAVLSRATSDGICSGPRRR